jgi:hypothetical protein
VSDGHLTRDNYKVGLVHFVVSIVAYLSYLDATLTKIVGLISNDTGYNDWIVHRFICNKS